MKVAVSLAVASVAAVATACTAERVERAAALPAWTVDARPLVSVGDREDTDSVVFYRVDDARWHAGRRVLVVADGGAFGLKVYSPDGTLLVQGGRRGRGPGEFSGRLALIDAPGDSVGVWDSGQGRWTMFNVVDGGMRNVTAELGQPVWFQAGIVVSSDAAERPAWLTPLLRRLTDSTQTRAARLDRSSLLFASEDAGLRSWQVYRDSVGPIASMTLPAGLSLTHIGDSAVVGIKSDSIGLEQVVVHALRRGTHEPPDRTPATPRAANDDARRQVASFLRNLVVAQEARFAEAGAYTAFADSLRLPPLPEGAELRILEQTDRGWSGVAWYRATGLTCGMIVGLTPPPGWMEGEVRCN